MPRARPRGGNGAGCLARPRRASPARRCSPDLARLRRHAPPAHLSRRRRPRQVATQKPGPASPTASASRLPCSPGLSRGVRVRAALRLWYACSALHLQRVMRGGLARKRLRRVVAARMPAIPHSLIIAPLANASKECRAKATTHPSPHRHPQFTHSLAHPSPFQPQPLLAATPQPTAAQALKLPSLARPVGAAAFALRHGRRPAPPLAHALRPAAGGGRPATRPVPRARNCLKRARQHAPASRHTPGREAREHPPESGAMKWAPSAFPWRAALAWVGVRVWSPGLWHVGLSVRARRGASRLRRQLG